MEQEEGMALYEAFANYAIDNLFWHLAYLNNAAFNTPLRTDIQRKLLSLNKAYETIIVDVYPTEIGRQLIHAMGMNNQLFINYVNHLLQNSNQTQIIRQRWLENGQQIAQLLSELNPYWRVAEWSAMIRHETDLLQTIAINLKDKEYRTFIYTAPICRRLAIDMSKYMTTGIAKQQQETW